MTTTKALVFTSSMLAAGLSPMVAANTLTVSHGYPPSHVFATEGVEPWMECVEQETNGTVSFNYFPSGQIASARDSFDAVTNGLADVSAAPIGYITNKMPLSSIGMLPNMGKNSVQAVNAFRAMLDNETAIAKEFESNRVEPIFVNMLGPYQVLSAVGPMDDLGDFSGRKFRSGGGTMTLAINSVGGAPAEMSGGDTYVAMQRGTLDAAILSLASVKPYSLEELVDAMSTNGQFGLFTTVFVINSDKFQGLGADDQAAVRSCGLKVEKQLAEYLDDQNAQLQKEFADLGVELYEFSEDSWAEISGSLSEVSDDFIRRLENRGLPAREVFEAYQSELNK